jgi:hypothetical protein
MQQLGAGCLFLSLAFLGALGGCWVGSVRGASGLAMLLAALGAIVGILIAIPIQKRS